MHQLKTLVSLSSLVVGLLFLCSCGEKEKNELIGNAAVSSESEQSSEEASPPTTGNDSTTTGCGEAPACQVVNLVNQIRVENNRTPLDNNRECLQAAQYHAEDMAKNNYFSHTSQDGTRAADRVKSFGGNYRGENIAKGQSSPGAAVSSWINSSGHRANILSSGSGSTGVGYALDASGRPVWVQVFCR